MAQHIISLRAIRGLYKTIFIDTTVLSLFYLFSFLKKRECIIHYSNIFSFLSIIISFLILTIPFFVCYPLFDFYYSLFASFLNLFLCVITSLQCDWATVIECKIKIGKLTIEKKQITKRIYFSNQMKIYWKKAKRHRLKRWLCGNG